MKRRIQQRVTSNAQVYGSFALICLVVIGIAGVGYHLLSPDGWIARFILHLWEKGATYTIFALLCLSTFVGIVKFWFFDGSHTKGGDWVAYLWAIAGLFFCIIFFTAGVF